MENAPLTIKTERPLPVTLENRNIETPFKYINTKIDIVNDIIFDGDLVIKYVNIFGMNNNGGSFQFDVFEDGQLKYGVPFLYYNSDQPRSQGDLFFVVKKGQTLKLVHKPGSSTPGTIHVYLAGYTVNHL